METNCDFNLISSCNGCYNTNWKRVSNKEKNKIFCTHRNTTYKPKIFFKCWKDKLLCWQNEQNNSKRRRQKKQKDLYYLMLHKIKVLDRKLEELAGMFMFYIDYATSNQCNVKTIEGSYLVFYNSVRSLTDLAKKLKEELVYRRNNCGYQNQNNSHISDQIKLLDTELKHLAFCINELFTCDHFKYRINTTSSQENLKKYVYHSGDLQGPHCKTQVKKRNTFDPIERATKYQLNDVKRNNSYNSNGHTYNEAKHKNYEKSCICSPSRYRNVIESSNLKKQKSFDYTGIRHQHSGFKKLNKHSTISQCKVCGTNRKNKMINEKQIKNKQVPLYTSSCSCPYCVGNEDDRLIYPSVKINNQNNNLQKSMKKKFNQYKMDSNMMITGTMGSKLYEDYNRHHNIQNNNKKPQYNRKGDIPSTNMGLFIDYSSDSSLGRGKGYYKNKTKANYRVDIYNSESSICSIFEENRNNDRRWEYNNIKNKKSYESNLNEYTKINNYYDHIDKKHKRKQRKKVNIKAHSLLEDTFIELSDSESMFKTYGDKINVNKCSNNSLKKKIDEESDYYTEEPVNFPIQEGNSNNILQKKTIKSTIRNINVAEKHLHLKIVKTDESENPSACKEQITYVSPIKVGPKEKNTATNVFYKKERKQKEKKKEFIKPKSHILKSNKYINPREVYSQEMFTEQKNDTENLVSNAEVFTCSDLNCLNETRSDEYIFVLDKEKYSLKNKNNKGPEAKTVIDTVSHLDINLRCDHCLIKEKLPYKILNEDCEIKTAEKHEAEAYQCSEFKDGIDNKAFKKTKIVQSVQSENLLELNKLRMEDKSTTISKGNLKEQKSVNYLKVVETKNNPETSFKGNTFLPSVKGNVAQRNLFQSEDISVDYTKQKRASDPQHIGNTININIDRGFYSVDSPNKNVKNLDGNNFSISASQTKILLPNIEIKHTLKKNNQVGDKQPIKDNQTNKASELALTSINYNNEICELSLTEQSMSKNNGLESEIPAGHAKVHNSKEAEGTVKLSLGKDREHTNTPLENCRKSTIPPNIQLEKRTDSLLFVNVSNTIKELPLQLQEVSNASNSKRRLPNKNGVKNESTYYTEGKPQKELGSYIVDTNVITKSNYLNISNLSTSENVGLVKNKKEQNRKFGFKHSQNIKSIPRLLKTQIIQHPRQRNTRENILLVCGNNSKKSLINDKASSLSVEAQDGNKRFRDDRISRCIPHSRKISAKRQFKHKQIVHSKISARNKILSGFSKSTVLHVNPPYSVLEMSSGCRSGTEHQSLIISSCLSNLSSSSTINWNKVAEKLKYDTICINEMYSI